MTLRRVATLVVLGGLVAGCAGSPPEAAPVPVGEPRTDAVTEAPTQDPGSDVGARVLARCGPVAPRIADLAVELRSGDAPTARIEAMEAVVARCLDATGRAPRDGAPDEGTQVQAVRRLVLEASASLASLRRAQTDRDRSDDTHTPAADEPTWRDLAQLAEQVRSEVDRMA